MDQNIFVIGQGGREHAIAWKLSKSNKVNNVYVCPGNGGTFLEENIINVDINIKDKDSIFTFNMNSIDRIVIDSKIYKNIYSEKGRTICEVIFESKQFSILKGFHLQSVEGSPNPMINRSTDKIIRKKRYYVLEDDSLDTFRFVKRKVLALVGLDKVTLVKEYAKRNDLSYRKEEEVKQILKYSSRL
jgi:hypothetical protein